MPWLRVASIVTPGLAAELSGEARHAFAAERFREPGAEDRVTFVLAEHAAHESRRALEVQATPTLGAQLS